MGGMLPPIKQGGGFTSPDLFSPLSPTKPPPLSLQVSQSCYPPVLSESLVIDLSVWYIASGSSYDP